jgi:hypothetical protein
MRGAINPLHHTFSWRGTWLSTGTTLPLPYNHHQQQQQQQHHRIRSWSGQVTSTETFPPPCFRTSLASYDLRFIFIKNIRNYLFKQYSRKFCHFVFVYWYMLFLGLLQHLHYIHDLLFPIVRLLWERNFNRLHSPDLFWLWHPTFWSMQKQRFVCYLEDSSSVICDFCISLAMR